MEVRLVSGVRDHVGGLLVGAVNFWQREGRMTATVVLPDENLFLGVGDVFTVGELECRVLGFAEDSKNRDVLVLDIPGLEVTVEEKVLPTKVVRLEEEQFKPEEKVTCLFQSAPTTLGGIHAGMGKFGGRDGRLSGVLFLRKRTQVVFLHDEFDVGLGRFRLLAIQRTESGNFWEAFVQEIGPAHEPWSPEEEERELEESRRQSQLRKKTVTDNTFATPRQEYASVLEKLMGLSCEILQAMDEGAREFHISKWQETQSEKMHRAPREGDLGPDVTVVKTAVINNPDAGAAAKVVTTQWSPGNVAGISAGVDWYLADQRLFCSLHCDKEGDFEKVCVMGPERARAVVIRLLLGAE